MGHFSSFRKHRILVLLKYSALTPLACVALAHAAPLNVACNLPLSGPRATYGKAVLEGIEMERAERDESEKVLVSYNFEDNQSDPKTAITVIEKQLTQTPDIYISGVKPEYMAIETRIKNARIPHFPWVFDFNLRPSGEINYRTWVNFNIEPHVFLEYANQVGARSIVIVRADLPIYEEEYRKHIIPQLNDSGLSVRSEIVYPIDKTDFRDLATRVKALNADFYILAGFQENLIGMIKAFNRLRLIKDGNTIVTYDLLDAAPLFDSTEIEGIRVVTPKFLVEGASARYQAWRQKFIELNGGSPLYTHAYAYDMALMLNEAARHWDGNTKESLIKALNSVDILGISGPLKFNNDGDLSYEVIRGVYREGKVWGDY